MRLPWKSVLGFIVVLLICVVVWRSSRSTTEVRERAPIPTGQANGSGEALLPAPSGLPFTPEQVLRDESRAVSAALDEALANAFQSQEKFDNAMNALIEQHDVAIQEIRKSFVAAGHDFQKKWALAYISSLIESEESLNFLTEVFWEPSTSRGESELESEGMVKLRAFHGASDICKKRPCDHAEFLRNVAEKHDDTSIVKLAATLYISTSPDQESSRMELFNLLSEDKRPLIPEKIVPLSEFTPDLFEHP